MNRIATSTSYSAVLAELMAAENRQQAAAQQVSSQKIADNLSGYGNQTSALVATQSVKTRVDGLVSQLTQTNTKLTFQQSGLEQVSTVAQSLKQAVTEALGVASGDGLMATVQSLFTQAASALNSQYNGEYLFSGGQTGTAPFSASSLSQLASQPSVSSFFQNGTITPTSRIDDNTTVQTGFLATDVGQSLMSAFQSLQAFQQSGSGNFGGDLTTAQQTFLTNMSTQLDAIEASTTQTTAQGGNVQNQVQTALNSQSARQTTLKGVLDGMTDANMADAASQLTQAQTAVQASAQVFATLKGMSLLNYLSPPTS